MSGKFRRSHPALPPNGVVAQIAPGNDLRGFGVSRLNLHQLNGVGGQGRRYDPDDQKMLLFGNGRHRCPFGQQQFFGAQWVHGAG